MLFVTEDCVDWWRTVPALQHDELKREDIDTKMEDHAGDDCRYGCMARPVSRVKRAKAPGLKPWSLDWVIQQDEQAKKSRR
jgi:hypothetical protein